jgi:hypothetical protein
VRINDADAVTVVRDVASTDGASYDVNLPVRDLHGGPMTLLVQPKRYCFEEPTRRPFAWAPPRKIMIDSKMCRP